jgi:hypothetical protein
MSPIMNPPIEVTASPAERYVYIRWRTAFMAEDVKAAFNELRRELRALPVGYRVIVINNCQGMDIQSLSMDMARLIGTELGDDIYPRKVISWATFAELSYIRKFWQTVKVEGLPLFYSDEFSDLDEAWEWSRERKDADRIIAVEYQRRRAR